jgi:peptide/nickel transport system substrate-binding protein
MRYLTALLLTLQMAFVAATDAWAQKSKDQLLVGLARMPESLNAHLDSSREGQIVWRHIFDALLEQDPNTLAIGPGIAERWTEIDDKTIEFKLRPGIKFHDGTPLDADVVVHNFSVFRDFKARKYQLPTRYEWMDRAEKIDDLTVRVHARVASPLRLVRLAWLPILPKDYWIKEGDAGMAMRPIGSGPYRVIEHKLGSLLVLERFEDYKGHKQRPAIKTLRISAVASAETRVAQLLAGQIDWDFDLSPDQTLALRGNPKLQILKAPTYRMGLLQLDAANRSGEAKPLTDIRVRHAIAHAIDRETIVKSLWEGTSDHVLKTFCTQQVFGCVGDFKGFAYDPARAKALLAEAGYADGFETTLYANADRPDVPAIAAYLGKVGIRTKVNVLPIATFRKLQSEGKLTIAFGNFGGAQLGDMEGIVPYYYGGGPWDYARDDRVKGLLERSRTTLERNHRLGVFRELVPYLHQQQYIVPLNLWTRTYVFGSTLDWKPTPDELPRLYEARWK